MKNFLNIEQIAQRYGVSKATVHNWRNKGILPQGLKLGGLRLWTVSEIEALEHMKGDI